MSIYPPFGSGSGGGGGGAVTVSGNIPGYGTVSGSGNVPGSINVSGTPYIIKTISSGSVDFTAAFWEINAGFDLSIGIPDPTLSNGTNLNIKNISNFLVIIPGVDGGGIILYSQDAINISSNGIVWKAR